MKRKNIIIICALMAVGAPLSSYAQLDSSALNYMLQRPQVAKSYKNKKFMDHMFMEFGFGGNLMGRHNVALGPTAELGIGDWISPEHGLRLNFNGGAYRIADKKVKFATAALDYMLNITAIAQPGSTYRQKPFELYGIAGIDATYSRAYNNNDHGFGAHLGMRGQFAFSDITYFYLEPHVGVAQDNVAQTATWRNLHPMASVTMGFGVRMPDERRSNTRGNYVSPHSFADGLFASVMAGPMYMGSAAIEEWKENMGMTVGVSLGKWMDNCNALQINLNTTTFDQHNGTRVRAIGARLDYLLNLHNAFGGLNPDRRFWMNTIAGVGYNDSRDARSSNRYTWNAGAGLQANFRLSRDINFVLEPRVDAYNHRWAPKAYTFGNIDATASLLAGFVYTYHEGLSRSIHDNEGAAAMRRSSFALTGGAAVRLFQYNEWKRYMPVVRMSYTHWTAPMTGWRYSLQGMFGRPINKNYYGVATAGFDWMTDLTALTYGCDNTRTLSVRSLLGVNLGADHSDYTRLNTDVHGGGQLAFRVSPNVNILAETQLGYELTSRYKGARSHRLQPQVQVGVEYFLQRSNRNKDLDEAPTMKDFVFLGAGTGIYSGNLALGGSLGRNLTILTDVGYGRWFNQVSGIQASVGNTVVPSHRLGSKTVTALRADYMMNLKSAITGESTEDQSIQLTGLIGAQVAASTKKHRSTNFAPGIHAAIQTGVMVTPHTELYFEPSATMYTKNLETSVCCSPIKVELRFSIGTKYHF